MRTQRIEAQDFLSSLRQGDAVTFTDGDGKSHDMFVLWELNRPDGGYAAYESARVTVTYGLGRYSREVSVRNLADGTVKLTRRDAAPSDELLALANTTVS